jgi:Contractile injection system tube protein/LysM domain
MLEGAFSFAASLTPANSASKGSVKAHLEILVPKVDDPIIPLRFNPTEYQLQKSNSFAEIPIPGLESPPIQFVRGASEKLTAELLVDTSDTLEDVRVRYVNKLRDLLRLNADLHAPPIVRFTWDSQIFVGVIESLNITYVLFTPKGIPLRAKLSLALKEYRPAAVQVKESPKHSPDFEKAYTVRRGDTLSGIAAAVYRDPAVWRTIAGANGIKDPRRLRPGRLLTLPRLQ